MQIGFQKNSPSTYSTSRIELKERFKMEVPKKVWRQMMYLCSKIGKDEWSGVMFYKSIGSITDLKNFKVIAQDIFLKDIGNSTYTEYESGEEEVDFLMADERRMLLDRGKIHSHNTMAVFHSGTDWQDLWDNSETHNYYLSFIVNNRGDVEVKIAWRSQEYTGNYFIKDNKGRLHKRNYEDTHPQGVLIVADGDIVIKDNTPMPEDWFIKRYEEVVEESKKRPVTNFQTYSTGASPKYNGWGNSAQKSVIVNNPYTEQMSLSPARFFSDLVSLGVHTSIDESIRMVDGYSREAFNKWKDTFFDVERWNRIFKKHFGNNDPEKERSVVTTIRNICGDYKHTAPEVYWTIDEMFDTVLKDEQNDPIVKPSPPVVAINDELDFGHYM